MILDLPLLTRLPVSNLTIFSHLLCFVCGRNGKTGQLVDFIRRKLPALAALLLGVFVGLTCAGVFSTRVSQGNSMIRSTSSVCRFLGAVASFHADGNAEHHLNRFLTSRASLLLCLGAVEVQMGSRASSRVSFGVAATYRRWISAIASLRSSVPCRASTRSRYVGRVRLQPWGGSFFCLSADTLDCMRKIS